MRTPLLIAAARGVRVRIYTNGPESEAAILYNAQRSYYRALIEGGIELFETQSDYNHAKLGVSTSGRRKYAIFGDMNQQGALRPGYAYGKQKCSSSQNGRGGLFYVMQDPQLHASLSSLLDGESAPTRQPPRKKTGSSR